MFLFSCTEDKLKKDVSDVDIKLNLVRFEKELFATAANPIQKFNSLERKHKTFYGLFTQYMVRTADKNDSLAKANLLGFVTDKDIQAVYKSADSLYSDFSSTEEQLSDALKHYKVHFPGKVIPTVYTFVSGFNYAVISADSILGIGLDMYLGPECKYYPALGLPQYKIERMKKEYILTDCIKGWAQSEYPFDETKKDFLSNIIYYGILYYQDAILPEVNDSLKIGFSESQLKWCQASESSIWAFFISKKILYSTNYSEYHKFINEGPSTNGFPKEAPSLLGNWIGWQIVRSYMEKNQAVTLEQLMNEQDAQRILTESKYKPKK